MLRQSASLARDSLPTSTPPIRSVPRWSACRNPRDQVEQRRLAAPRGSHQRQELARLHIQIQLLQRRDGRRPAPIRPRQSRDTQSTPYQLPSFTRTRVPSLDARGRVHDDPVSRAKALQHFHRIPVRILPGTQVTHLCRSMSADPGPMSSGAFRASAPGCKPAAPSPPRSKQWGAGCPYSSPACLPCHRSALENRRLAAPVMIRALRQHLRLELRRRVERSPPFTCTVFF